MPVQGPGRRWSRPLVGLLIIVLALAGTLGIVYPVGYYVPRQLEILSQGQFTMPVPLTVAQSAPNLTWAMVHTLSTLYIGSTSTKGSASFRFDWSLAAPASLPVVFSTNIPDLDSGYGAALGGGAFEYLPSGECTGTCIRESVQLSTNSPGSAIVAGAIWSFNYTVRLMSRLEGLGSVEFIEVDLSPTSLGSTVGYSLPHFGVANATSSELQLLQAFNMQAGPIVGFSTNESAFQARAFGYSPAPVAIGAGAQGLLSLRLTSSYHWSPVFWETVTFSGSGGNFSVREYMDLRFGSIVLDVGPWIGI